MATVESQEAPLSPGSQEKINFLLETVRSGKAHLQPDAEGKMRIVYADEITIPLSGVDKSQANTIQVGRDASDVRRRINASLEMIDAIKQTRAPSGVVIDKTKAGVSRLGQYREGKEFEQLKEVLGSGNCAGDIVVVKDNKTGIEHAVKTMMISEFSTNEVRAWVDLGESESFPNLYLFRLDGNKITFHMEKIEHGVTLDNIINEHMHNLRKNEPELARPFSLCILHGLLSTVKEMHDKRWTHRDLHGGNIMIAKDTMTLKVLDFGMARPLQEGLNFQHDDMKNDILNAIRLFCGLYIGNDFLSNFKLEKTIKDGTLKEVLSETACLSQEEREELLQLIMMTYQVTRDRQQAGYGSASPVMEHIEQNLFPDKTMDIMRKAAAVLFPEMYMGDRDVRQTGASRLADTVGEEMVDGPGISTQMMENAEEFDLDRAAAAVPEELLQRLQISLGTNCHKKR